VQDLKLVRLTIDNFRCIKHAELFFSGHTVLVGDNNIGKSTVLEAIDLVLGPERLRRIPPINEHDFFAGEYLSNEECPVEIKVEVVIAGLSDEQLRHFSSNIEWWNTEDKQLITEPPPEQTDNPNVVPALRVAFIGSYNPEEDDFEGKTYYMSPQSEDGSYSIFGTNNKRNCGFLYLRTLRTGTRALSLERGSLLDIILRLKKLRLKMWENILQQLRTLSVADEPELGVSDILSSVQSAVQSLMPVDCADNPHLRVSNLTRENLREILTVFMSTGSESTDGTEYNAPFKLQGTGTINALVLSLLSIIAELKQSVIFAMEEPEIGLPPHTQKRIIESVISKSSQAIFTSHSPYVLEEFSPDKVVLLNNCHGELQGTPAQLPPSVKLKGYREELRRRFCEALLASRVLIAEGRTEYDAFISAARRLHELDPDNFKTLSGLGVAVINAGTDAQVEPLARYFTSLGKTVFAVYDRQEEEVGNRIKETVTYPFEAPEKGFENVILNGSQENALRRYALCLVDANLWPNHLRDNAPTAETPNNLLKETLSKFFRGSKGEGTAADFLYQCSVDEMPTFLVDTLKAICTVILGNQQHQEELVEG